MSDHSVETGKRVVVSGRWDGNVIPGQIEELNREVIVRPNSQVTGCVFGRTVRIEGPAEISRAIYATEELEIIPSGTVRLESSIGSRGVLIVRGSGARTLVAGDVSAATVHLKDCLVRGSVHGDEVVVEGCLILGVVHGHRKVQLTRSTALTAYGGSVGMSDDCSLILPYAQAQNSLTVENAVGLLGFPSEDSHLTAEDIVVDDEGVQHLIAGRRLTDLVKTREHLENLRNFMSQIALQDLLRAAPDELPVNPDRLPAEVSGWIQAGLLDVSDGRVQWHRSTA